MLDTAGQPDAISVRPSREWSREKYFTDKSNTPSNRFLGFLRVGIAPSLAKELSGISDKEAKKLAKEAERAEGEGKERVDRARDSESRRRKGPFLGERRETAERKWVMRRLRERNREEPSREIPRHQWGDRDHWTSLPSNSLHAPSTNRHIAAEPPIERRIAAASPNTIAYIQLLVCRRFSISLEMLTTKTRRRKVVDARQIAMYLCRELLDASMPLIGRKFGGFDHTTVLYAIRKVEARIQSGKLHLKVMFPDLFPDVWDSELALNMAEWGWPVELTVGQEGIELPASSLSRHKGQL